MILIRKVKTIFKLIFCFCLSANIMFGNGNQEKNANKLPNYKKVEILFTSNDVILKIAKLGVDVHCGVNISESQGIEKITLEVSDYEYDLLQKAGLNPIVKIDDLSNFYAKRSLKELPKAKEHLKKMKSDAMRYKKFAQNMGCVEDSYPIPQNFELGSMGGFTTYQEMLNELDQMRSLYPNLISVRLPASTSITTIEGRTVYYVRLSDNPDVDENEPEVFYNGVHHAREPLSMMNQLYYMWYLLENYNTDERVKNIVDNVEMYFIPVVNPDGYVYNQTTNPNGGGLWRKNRRNNGNGTIGVDLNRNYGYQWGYDNSGSSGNSNTETYRGPSPFSEPETRIMRDFTNEREFINAFNNHSYSNLMLHAWGYVPGDCPDEELFDEISEQMCWHNRYNYGNNNKVLYPTNGDANDWMYGEQTTKRKILAWIPEIGSSAEGGFWPSPSLIVPQSERQMHMSLLLAQSAANFGVINDLTPYGIENQNPTLTFNIEHLSLVPGSFTVTVSSSDPNVVSITNPVINTGVMTDTNYETISTGVTLANGIAAGTPISFDIVVNNGAYNIYTTTITKVYKPVELLSDDGANLSNWTSSGGWGATNSTGYNSGSSITDSPIGNMSTAQRTLTLNNPINLSSSQNPVLEYYTKWDIYRLFDYAQIQVSTNGNNWTELCGVYTKQGASPDNVWAGNTGTPDQPTGDGLYDGYQKEWVREQIDLSSYAGVNTLFVRFLTKGDSKVSHNDGIYIDNFTIYREPLGHCENGIQDADEVDVDCGGANCLACPTCFDGIQNGNEAGIDCGGSDCAVCPPCPMYDFNTYPVLSYDSDQDFGSYQVQNGGTTLYITGNAWKAIDISYTVTQQTVITFDFKSTVEGEIHELAFDNDLLLDRDQSLVVYGNQGYAGTLNNNTYSGSGNWESFAVDIGTQFTGTYQYLALTADDDTNSAGNSYYRNIKIFEDTDGDLACDLQCSIGAACDDNDACTTGETFDSNCNCSGGTLVDSDNDGVCDVNDVCAGLDDNLINQLCDDGDICTTGETYDATCNCAGGIFQDADNDGVCDANDICANGDDNVDTNMDSVPDACYVCLNTIVETNNPSILYNREANVSISTNGSVLNGANVEYNAGERITLKASFEVELGAEFRAYIAPCY